MPIALSRTTSLTNTASIKLKAKRSEVSANTFLHFFFYFFYKFNCSSVVLRKKSIEYNDNDANSSVRSEDVDQFHIRSMQNRLDVKYELFLKWLQTNEMVGDTQTDDECTSQVLSSDDEDNFVDTETDYPLFFSPELISTTAVVQQNDCTSNVYSKLLSADYMENSCGGESSGKATPTPSLLSVMSMTDYDSSMSDISGISVDTKLTRRKAKHNKGKAPPIPIPLSVQLMEYNHDVHPEAHPTIVPVQVEENSEKRTILNFLPGFFRSKSPVKNQTEAEAVDVNNDKFETHI